MTGVIKDVCIFDEPLTRQPVGFLMNNNQQLSIVSSPDDGIYFNQITQDCVDLNELFNIEGICQVIHDKEDGHLYLLANRHQDKIGINLIRFNEQNPEDYKFFLKYNNKLDIGDADISIIKNKEKGFKELLISYKSIY